jgi:hypothetical protein
LSTIFQIFFVLITSYFIYAVFKNSSTCECRNIIFECRNDFDKLLMWNLNNDVVFITNFDIFVLKTIIIVVWNTKILVIFSFIVTTTALSPVKGVTMCTLYSSVTECWGLTVVGSSLLVVECKFAPGQGRFGLNTAESTTLARLGGCYTSAQHFSLSGARRIDGPGTSSGEEVMLRPRSYHPWKT